MSENQDIKMDAPEYQSFINPFLALELWDSGLQLKTVFMWKVKDGQVQLFTSMFDPDGIYKAAESIIEIVCPAEREFAAFQLGDLERLMPDYTIGRHQRDIDLMVDMAWNVPYVRSKRLPDVFALMALQLIKKDKSFINRALDELSKNK